MRKKDELATPTSCLNKAKDDELLFVLLGRDQAAPAAIQFWCYERVRLGLNKGDDPQIKEALACALSMINDRNRQSQFRMVGPFGEPDSL